MRFGTDDSSLYYQDISTTTMNIALATTTEQDIVWNTVNATKCMALTNLKKAGTVCHAQQMTAFPFDTYYDNMVRGHMP